MPGISVHARRKRQFQIPIIVALTIGLTGVGTTAFASEFEGQKSESTATASAADETPTAELEDSSVKGSDNSQEPSATPKASEETQETSEAEALEAPKNDVAAGESCITGHLQYTLFDAETETTPVRFASHASWELIGASSKTADATSLAEGYTDASGKFSMCVSHGTVYDAQIKFEARTDKPVRVVASNIKSDTTPRSFTTPARTISGIQEPEIVNVPEEEAGAWNIITTLESLWEVRESGTNCWTGHETSDCTDLTYVWPVTPGSYWDYSGPQSGTRRVILQQEDPQSQHLIIHEAGHWLQWMLYDKKFPEVDSACDDHYIELESSPSCAWTEGFADSLAAWVLGDRRFVWPTGFSWGLENPDGIVWDGGDATQGNVGGALLDLYERDGFAANIQALTFGGEPELFKDFMTSARPSQNLPFTQSVADILAVHGINYELPGEKDEVTPDPEKDEVKPSPEKDEVKPSPEKDEVKPNPEKDEVKPNPEKDEVKPDLEKDEVKPNPEKDEVKPDESRENPKTRDETVSDVKTKDSDEAVEKDTTNKPESGSRSPGQLAETGGFSDYLVFIGAGLALLGGTMIARITRRNRRI